MVYGSDFELCDIDEDDMFILIEGVDIFGVIYVKEGENLFSCYWIDMVFEFFKKN